mgnify:FL=1
MLHVTLNGVTKGYLAYNQFCWHWWLNLNVNTNYLITIYNNNHKRDKQILNCFYTQNEQPLLHSWWFLSIHRIISLSVMKATTPNYEHEMWFKSCHKRRKISKGVVSFQHLVASTLHMTFQYVELWASGRDLENGWEAKSILEQHIEVLRIEWSTRKHIERKWNKNYLHN